MINLTVRKPFWFTLAVLLSVGCFLMLPVIIIRDSTDLVVGAVYGTFFIVWGILAGWVASRYVNNNDVRYLTQEEDNELWSGLRDSAVVVSDGEFKIRG